VGFIDEGEMKSSPALENNRSMIAGSKTLSRLFEDLDS
jgi:hypothetical protein